MQEYREPLFCKGRVLKKESLEALRDFPLRFARLKSCRAEYCRKDWKP